jgi:transcription elongation factor Elf1
MQDVFQFLGNCPFCHQKFEKEKAKILSRKKGIFEIYVECKKCGTSSLITIMRTSQNIITSFGRVTDLSEEDLKKIGKLSPLSFDEVLKWHKKL